MECFGTQCLTGIAHWTHSLSIIPTRSHVPYKGLNHRPAMYMPEASTQVPVYLVLGLDCYPGFDHHLATFDTSSVVHFHSTL